MPRLGRLPGDSDLGVMVMMVMVGFRIRCYRVTGESGRMGRPEIMSESEMTRWVSRKERMGESCL